MTLDERIDALRPIERGFLHDVLDTLELFQINHESPVRLRLTGKYPDGATVDLDESWPVAKRKTA